MCAVGQCVCAGWLNVLVMVMDTILCASVGDGLCRDGAV